MRPPTTPEQSSRSVDNYYHKLVFFRQIWHPPPRHPCSSRGLLQISKHTCPPSQQQHRHDLWVFFAASSNTRQNLGTAACGAAANNKLCSVRASYFCPMDPTQHQHHRHAYHSFMGVPAAGQRQQRCVEEEEDDNTRRRNECAREANRVHCKETRDRKRERERLLAEVQWYSIQQWFVLL